MSRAVAHHCCAGVVLLVLSGALPACGRKTDVRPPELVAPAVIRDLEAENAARGVALSWRRPSTSADGNALLDLDSFVIERALPGEPFAFISRVTVGDRDRLRQQKRFTYLDEGLRLGESYRYRVLAVTVDGYVSHPSNVVDIVRGEPPPTPVGVGDSTPSTDDR